MGNVINISRWTSHHNMFLYAAHFYFLNNKESYSIRIDKSINTCGVEMLFRDNKYYFDYSDSPEFISNPADYRLYFKRSLLINEVKYSNLVPLGFQLNYSYRPLDLIRKVKIHKCFSTVNIIEFMRALDFLGLVSNMSHASMDITTFPKKVTDNSGKILYYTRLWDPANNNNLLEKERRNRMNKFRVNAVRIIRKAFPESAVGLYPSPLAEKVAPDLVLDKKSITKKNYLVKLSNSDICIADDGLKDTPGWKIGEYVLFGKAIISTPISIAIPGFFAGINYLSLSSKDSTEELPGLIINLLDNDKYLSMCKKNYLYGQQYIHPAGYFKQVIRRIEKA